MHAVSVRPVRPKPVPVSRQSVLESPDHLNRARVPHHDITVRSSRQYKRHRGYCGHSKPTKNRATLVQEVRSPTCVRHIGLVFCLHFSSELGEAGGGRSAHAPRVGRVVRRASQHDWVPEGQSCGATSARLGQNTPPRPSAEKRSPCSGPSRPLGAAQGPSRPFHARHFSGRG